ncbi:Prefoldin alpha-like [Parasponia andersonii]|uniref:Prefoldin alpha-like n=1 Tax=Parasponia andersonii TaxID=3476 RepID=A0A2P5BLN3_PARAD|nr:Prefoldin alpha-like [Parasponia andersonii]
MEMLVKGTVAPLSSLFGAEEAQKAAKRVQDTIDEKQLELDRLRGFISENANLINTVPFGKAAFFPGRLIHTNEFMVLLGEGYYAETTSKQTVEILKRRGKNLESQVDSLNAMMLDLKAEASFFDRTASEAEEGIVEIREDYVEESSVDRESEPVSSSISEEDNKKVKIEDEDFARIMSRFDELEKEELAAESNNEGDEDEPTKADLDSFSDKISLHGIKNPEKPESRKPMEQAEVKKTVTKASYLDDDKQYYQHKDFACTGLTVQSMSEDGSSHSSSLDPNVKKSTEKTLLTPEMENNLQAFSSLRTQVPVQTPKPPKFDSQKAFTGSIVEHADNIETSSRKQTPSQSSGSQPSKPVSRFKMQRR